MANSWAPVGYYTRRGSNERTRAMTISKLVVGGALVSTLLLGCGEDGSQGPAGPTGRTGGMGDMGPTGPKGDNGVDGRPGVDGKSCPVGNVLTGQVEGVAPTAPLSSVVALGFCDLAQTNSTNIPDYVKALVTKYGTNSLPMGFDFPL